MANANYIDRDGVCGYIIDAACLIFDRNDGKSFLMKHPTGGSVATTRENVTISNGWISSPQAIIDTTSTTTVSYTSNLSDLMLIAGVNNTSLSKVTSSVVRDGDEYEFVSSSETEATITINDTVTNVYVDGFTEDTTDPAPTAPTTGKFLVTAGTGTTTLTFLKSDITIGDVIPVMYDLTKTTGYEMSVLNTTKSAIGELTRITPVYAQNDESSDIVAYIRDYFPRVKVTGLPGFDQNYKSESSHTIEFQTLAPRAANSVSRKIYIG